MADEELSQAEIDALLNASGSESSDASAGSESSPAESEDTGANEKSVNELSQDELDALLNDNSGGETPKEAAGGVAVSAESRTGSEAPEEVVARPVQFPNLQEGSGGQDSKNLDFIMDVSLRVSVELGRAKVQVKDVLQLGLGSVVQLDKLAGEPVDILINGKLIAHGEVVVVDENFGVKIVDIISAEQRVQNLK